MNRDAVNPMVRQARQGAAILAEIFRNQGAIFENTGLNEIGDTIGKGV